MKYLVNPRIYLIIIIISFVLHSLHFNFVCDDAFISFRYAKNFISGHGLVWNIGGEPVEGYTNFLWVIVTSLFMKIGFEPVIVSKVLGIFFGLCSIVLTYFFSELIFQRKSLLNLIAPVMLGCCGPFAAWSSGGLETQLFTLLTLTAGITYLYEIDHHNDIPMSAILFALASLTRPEGLLLFGLACLHRFFHLLLTKENLLSQDYHLVSYLHYHLWCLFLLEIHLLRFHLSQHLLCQDGRWRISVIERIKIPYTFHSIH